MSDLLDSILSTFPANNDTGVPLGSNITITLQGTDYDEDTLKEGFFVEGPDTDQFVGPGLVLQSYPDNISQGDLDDFLQSPGYNGIVQGTVTVTGISGNTLITFDPSLSLVPSVTYIVNLTQIQTAANVDIDGFVSFSFESGSGSIEAVPDTISSSVLNAGITESALSSDGILKIVSTSPKDRSVEQSIELKEILVNFNKELDSDSINTSLITVKTIPATDHPSATINSLGDLVKNIEVLGKQLKIKI